MSRLQSIIVGACLALSCNQGAAFAEGRPRLYVHLGPGDVILSPSAVLSAGPNVIPGATITANNSWTAVVEAGVFLSKNVAVSYTGGIPPVATNYGAGTIQSVGRLGAVRYGPMSLTAHYHLTGLGRLRPYIGGGAVYMQIFSTSDGALTQLRVSNHFGYAGQVGADYDIDPHWGAFVDFKKAHLHTSASGLEHGVVPITAKVTLNPAVVQFGAAYRF